MFSKVLLFILISCASTFASPAYRDKDRSNGANYPTNEEVQVAVENILIKIAQAIKEILQDLTKQIGQGLNSEDLKKSVDHLKETLEKAFNSNENAQSPSEQAIQGSVNEAINNICEVFKGVFTAFFQKVEEKLNDEGLKKSIEHLKIILEKIFNYDNVNKEQRSRYALRSEKMKSLTNRQLEKIGEGLKDLFQVLFEQIIANAGDKINSSEAEEVKNVLQGIFNEQNEDER